VTIKPRPVVETINPYRPGKPEAEVQRELGLTRIVKLASNENSLGPSPLARAAVEAALPNIFRYPEGSGHYLVHALAKKFDLEFDRIVLGNGANDLIELAAKTFVGAGDNIVTGYPSFIVYEIVAKLMEAECRNVPLKDYRFDLSALAAAIDGRTRLVIIANPNNPTGTIVKRKELEAFLDRVPASTLVLMDEAYFDFAEDPEYPDSLNYVRAGRAVMTMRSFSKNYGLAGLRLGWAAAHPDVIAPMHRIRQPFNTNLLAQVAGVAALGDDEHLANSRYQVRKGRESICAGLDAIGVKYVRSQANFVLILLGMEGKGVYESLLQEGVIVRPMAGWGYPQAIRVTVGTTEENGIFLEAFRKVMGI
jgi:histidinol-phosphate aminotransferase